MYTILRLLKVLRLDQLSSLSQMSETVSLTSVRGGLNQQAALGTRPIFTSQPYQYFTFELNEDILKEKTLVNCCTQIFIVRY